MLKIAICDDDAVFVEDSSRMLERISKKNEIAISITKYDSAEKLLFDWDNVKRQADALYLDIHMAGTNGFQAAEKLRKMGCAKEIIFLTKDREFVYSAFDVDAFHYIVKDNENSNRFEEIFLKLAERIEKKAREYITFSYGGENRDVAIDEIKYFQVDVRIVTVYYGIEESFSFYSAIGKLESLFCSRGFVKIHRSTIVNIAYIKRITYEEVVLQDGKILVVGRSHLQRLKEIMGRLDGGEDE